MHWLSGEKARQRDRSGLRTSVLQFTHQKKLKSKLLNRQGLRTSGS